MLAVRKPVDMRSVLGANSLIRLWGTRDAWLAGRTDDSIGASDAAMALGVSSFGTAWKLWARKKGFAKAESSTEVLERGHRWESAVLAEYADESGFAVLDAGHACGGAPAEPVTIAHKDRPWLRATPDGFAYEARTGQYGWVEAKTALRANVWAPEPGIVIDRWDDAHATLVPPPYAIQGYVQLSTTDLPWVDLTALVPRNGWLAIRWVRLMRDEETQGQITEALALWRDNHLVQGVPPPLDGSEPCNRYLAKQFPSPSGKEKPTRGANAEDIDLMVELARVNARMKTDKERHDELKNFLIARAKGERLSLGIAYGQPQNNKGRTSYDMDSIRAEAPELVQRFSTPGEPFVTFNLYRFDAVLAAKAAMEAEEGK